MKRVKWAFKAPKRRVRYKKCRELVRKENEWDLLWLSIDCTKPIHVAYRLRAVMEEAVLITCF